MNKELIEIEKWEYHYFNEIFFLMSQDMDKMIIGLASKDKIKDDWKEKFAKIEKKR